MCGRYQFSLEEQTLCEFWKQAQQLFPDAKMKSGEIFPTDIVPVLVGEGDALKAQPMKWGFPHFNDKGVIINARAESAGEKRMFCNCLAAKRCVIPTSGFFEWGSNRTKYLFREPAAERLYLAGLYDDFDGERRFVILTKAANGSVSDIHDRMPVILQERQIHTWINDGSRTRELWEQDLILEREEDGYVQQSLY